MCGLCFEVRAMGQVGRLDRDNFDLSLCKWRGPAEVLVLVMVLVMRVFFGQAG